MRLNNFSLNFKQAYIGNPNEAPTPKAKITGYHSFEQNPLGTDSFVLSSAPKLPDPSNQFYDPETPKDPLDYFPYSPSIPGSDQPDQFYDPEGGVEFDEELW